MESVVLVVMFVSCVWKGSQVTRGASERRVLMGFVTPYSVQCAVTSS